ncbi:ribonuclease H-like domain-containing protein [Pseudoalteromonas shioyasakiensis]|uniref:exonuclease domain-containing protein n=1 Tax=Pseudoalteromonas shioyasakiensis TaxID=1190813 RepID=UPI001EFD4D11|nr:exonuclease domain-containing protein [Pseudoalteromonas shioyasakiensis]MCG9735332.1 ribonuclease H-like domain-containing protein [Pseudoalteromonas shioyasakiensis]
MTKYVFLDTETTGLDPHKSGHRIIDLAGIEYRDGKQTGHVFNMKINPEGKKSTKGAFKVHKISGEELIGKPTFKKVAEDFIKDAHLAIYNASFDIQFINSELNRINYPSSINDIWSEITCEMELTKLKFNSEKNISQDNPCKRYGIDISNRKAHGGLIDASLCAELFFKLTDERSLEKYKDKRKLMPKPTSPAMRLNLVKQVFKAQDILSFSRNKELINTVFKSD